MPSKSENSDRNHRMGVTVISPHSLPQYLHLQQSIPNQKAVKTSCLLSYGRRGGVLLGQNNHPDPTTVNSITTVPAMKLNSSSSSIAAEATSTGAAAAADDVVLELELGEIKDKYVKWKWKGQYAINYIVSHPEDANPNPNAPPILLVHGFGASVPHWRRNIKTLAKHYTVYAIDLIGFGASDKPIGFSYTMEKWAELILDFLDEVVQKPTVLIGNSVGSLACVISASESKKGLVRGLVLLNCSGGMNNKAIVDDWRIKLLFPLLMLIDFLLKQRPIASFIFERVRQRESLRNILSSVYANKESVDEELVEIIMEPTSDPGALDAFVSIVTGPPGPNPVQLMPGLSLPILVLWGDEDPFTPLDGPVGKYFTSLPSQKSNVSLSILQGVGHCPHDDRPKLVHDKLLPWLDNLSIENSVV
ncbi:putative chlorophyllase [Rosa chinensis]|uniref:Putative chlorophyllase n=1 Tax=Rosa chinensis TaxID=74649 RepID=A0A2P6PZJ2_ROSCH|nr:pheophytinase, chloroplastic isoform X2 [Rosa chinensis]PRQ27360.1 putative chlorophyllase [Rosa chinensis]